MDVVNKMAPTKTIRVKNNENEWFEWKIIEKQAVRDKLFRKLSVDEILYKEPRNTFQDLNKDKKKTTFTRKVVWRYRKTKRALENYKKLGS